MVNNNETTRELKDLVQTIEQLQAKATASGHQFLAYLLDMARMEAVLLLKQGQQNS